MSSAPPRTGPDPKSGARAPLDVFTAGRHVGTLGRSEVEDDTFVFGYSDGCPMEDAVSLTMPIVRDQYDSMGTVHPIFEMNLPEGALLEKLRSRFSKAVPDFDNLALLSIVGRSQIGRLRYAFVGSALEDVPVQDINELLTYEGAADLFADLLETYASYSGVSGVQPKVLVRAGDARSDTNGPALDRATHRGATHIVKSFDVREYPELAANEYFCLRAATLAGLPTVRAQLSENRRVLVVGRFDLQDDGSYLGCEDFCVLNGMRAHGRYDGSYELVAKRIGDFVSPQHVRAALEQFFATVALSCAIENGDAHLKNFAVLYENAERAVHLAPAYDLVSTAPYVRRDVLALTFGGSKAFPSRARVLEFGRVACGLSQACVDDLLERVAVGVQSAMNEIRAYAKKHATFRTAATTLTRGFQRGLERSILASGAS